MQILVVDSNNSNRELIESLLEDWGYTYRSVENGLQAWDLFRNEMFDVVISDWVVPGMEGPDLCRGIRSYERAHNAEAVHFTHFILCTEKKDPEEIYLGMAAGVDDYITKPFEHAEFKVRLDTGIRLLCLRRHLATTDSGTKSSLMQAKLALTTMLPAKRHGPDIRVDWYFNPSKTMGGTLFNVVTLDESHIAIYSLDVAGEGLAATLFAVTLGSLMIPRRHIDEMENSHGRPKFSWNRSPINVVTTLNERFLLANPSNIYSTLFYGVFNVKTATFKWVRAGHPPPILVRGSQKNMLDEGDPPIGLFRGFTYTEHTTKLERHDRLFLYSAGISETMDPKMEMFGQERLLSLFCEIGKFELDNAVGKVVGALHDHRSSDAFDDDLTLLAIEILC